MKTLIVIPKYTGGGRYIMPLGILYVSAAAKHAGHSVVTLNLNHIDAPIETVLKDVFQDRDITCVASGGLSGEYAVIFSLFKVVKNISPHITTICGGGLITAGPETAMRALEYVDIGIIGEGEITFPNVLSCLKNNGDLSSIPGLIFRNDTRLIQTQAADEIGDLDSLPLPDYQSFEYEKYLMTNHNGFDFNGTPLAPVSIIGSRSCPYSCTFCFHPTGVRYRTRSLDAIFKEIDFLLSNYNINCIALREELFAVDEARIAEFCQRIKEYPIYWTIQLRVNNVNENIVKLLADAKCFAVFIGIESISDTVLKSMNKKITSAQINHAVNLATRYKLQIRSGLIFGDRAETLETAEISFEWLQKNRNYIDILRRPAIIADMIIPFPGSPIYKYAVEKGIITDEVEYLKMGCPLVNLTSLSDADYKKMIRKVQKYSGRNYNFWNGNELEILEL